MRLLVLAFLFIPSIVAAQVKGVSLVYKHDPLASPHPITPGLSVGKVVAVYPDMDNNHRLKLLTLNGRPLSSPQTNATYSVAFAGEHLYVFDFDGLQVFDKDGKKVQTIKQKAELTYLTATPDGTTIFAVAPHAPASIIVYTRDEKTGKLTQTQVFQTDDAGLALAKASRLPKPIVIDPTAVRVPKFDGAAGTFTDGKRLFVACMYSNSVVVFAKTSKGWQHIQSLEETKTGLIRNGLAMCQSVTMNQHGDVFVGGWNCLCWLRLAGEELESVKWWIDDSVPGATPEVSLEFVKDVRALAFSKNGKYLFGASTDAEGVTVYKVGDTLEPIGTLKDSADESKTWDVAVVGDKLFAKTSDCQLLVYDLDAAFTK